MSVDDNACRIKSLLPQLPALPWPIQYAEFSTAAGAVGARPLPKAG
jgi:hypothetical protein